MLTLKMPIWMPTLKGADNGPSAISDDESTTR